MTLVNPFLGTWIGPDEYISEVEYTVRQCEGALEVTAVDPSDGESAVVREITLHDGALRFVALWPSTGREARCVFTLQPGGDVMLTYTYTDRARLIRRHA